MKCAHYWRTGLALAALAGICLAESRPASGQGTWTTAAPTPTPRLGLAAATGVGADGNTRIYAIGGTDLNTVEAYVP